VIETDPEHRTYAVRRGGRMQTKEYIPGAQVGMGVLGRRIFVRFGRAHSRTLGIQDHQLPLPLPYMALASVSPRGDIFYIHIVHTKYKGQKFPLSPLGQGDIYEGEWELSN